MNTIAKKLSKLLPIATLALILASCSSPEPELKVSDDFLASHELNVSLNDSANGLNINFNNQSDRSASYHLLRSSNKDCDIYDASVCTDVAELANSDIGSSGSFTDALPSNTYYYQLRVTMPGDVNSTLRAQYPDIDPPSNVIASAGDAQVSLSWDAVSGAESYNIYFANQDGVSSDSYDTKIASVISPFVVDGLSNGVTYYFVITAENSNNESGISEQAQATPLGDSNGNVHPIANAGADQQVFEGNSISLDGSSSSDSDGSIISYNWVQISGETVDLTDADSSIATFIAPLVASSITLEFQLTVTDNNSSSSSDTVVITVFDSAAPIADAGADQEVFESDTVSLDGSSSIDADGSIVSYSWEQTSGVDVEISNANSSTASFTAPMVDVTTELQFQLTVIDDDDTTSSDTVIITVLNNSPPTANSGADQAVYAASEVVLNGGSSSDPDDQIVEYNWTQIGGESVSLSSSSSSTATFTAPDTDEQLQLEFQLRVTDSYANSDSDTIIVYVFPTDGAELNSFELYFFDDGLIPGELAMSGDADWLLDSDTGGAQSTQYSLRSGKIEHNDSSCFAFSISNLESDAFSIDYYYKVSSESGYDYLRLYVDGAENADHKYSGEIDWTLAQYKLSGNEQELRWCYTKDGSQSPGQDTAWIDQISYSSSNYAPIASAGDDQVVSETSIVTLQGSGADVDGSIVSYKWQQVSSADIELTDSQSSSTSFTAPEVDATTTLEFQLTVTDDDGATATATVTITVENNEPPTAEAGAAQVVVEGNSVTLDGSSSSDSDGSIVSYSWEQTSGDQVALANSASVTTSFTAPEVDTSTNLDFQLTVTDDDGASATDTVIITVENNEPPIADAGIDQTVVEGSSVTLDGSNSGDSDGSIVSYSWEQVSGLEIGLSNSATATASFTAPEVTSDTTYQFQLTVTDDDGASATDTVSITVENNEPPIADAGEDQNVKISASVSLDGSDSDDSDGTIVSYSWRQISGTEVELTNADQDIASFTAPDAETTLEFELTVTDNDGTSASDSVLVNVALNVAPVANAGADQSVSAGSAVSLNGSGSSDSDGTIVSYSWRQISGTEVELTNADQDIASFTAPDAETTLEFELTVIDDSSASSSDRVLINVSANLAPIANAGANQSVTSGSTVNLNGSDSSDSDGSITSYSWTQIDGDITVDLLNASSAIASFTAPAVSISTVLQFQLSVSDDLGATGTDTVTVTISAVAPGVELWNYEAENNIGYSSPAIGADGTIYIGSEDTYLYALNPNNGSMKWRYKIGNIIASSPAVGADGTVYIGGVDRYLYALDPEDGSMKWRYQTPNGIYSSPAIGADGTVYVGTIDHHLYAIAPPSDDSQSGELLWSYQTSDDIYYSSPAIGANGTVYIGSRDDYLYAIVPPEDDSQSGVMLWRYQTAGDIDSSPAIGADGTVYIGSDDDYLYAISPPSNGSQSGVLKWRFESNNDIISSPTIGADGTIYVGSTDYYLYALDSTDGSLLWSYQTDGAIYSSPAVGSDGIIYVGSFDDYLYAVSPPSDSSQSGTLQWSFPTGDNIYSSPAIATDGAIYVGSVDDKVYAVSSSSAGLADSVWPKFGRDAYNTANANNPPSVSAGASQSKSEGTKVNLVGSATDESSVASYLWQQVSGIDVVIFAEDNASANFIAPQVDSDTELVFQLTATDDFGASASATTTVTIQNDPNNQPPVAEAGDDQTVTEGTTVELSGLNSSDGEGGSIQSYSWQQLNGAEVTIVTPNAAQASFIAPEASADSNLTLVFALTVTDAAGAQAVDTITITVENNEAPLVSAGSDQTAVAGVNVILYGSASDGDGTIDSLQWQETSDLGIQLSAYDVAVVSFIVPNFAVGTQFVFELNATDDDGASATATSTVTVTSEKTAQWTYTSIGNSDFDSSPALVDDGSIYIGGADGRLYAFNPDGSLDWNYSTGGAIYSSPAIANDGTIYIGSDDNSLYAISPNGNFEWSFTTTNYVRSSPAIAVDGRIYFGSYDNSIYALEADGSEIWSYSTGGDIYSSPLVGTDGVIYVGSLDGYLYALTATGALKWRYQTGGAIYSSPVQAPDGSIYVGSDDNYLYALARDDGSRLWRYSTSGDIYSSPAIGADGTIYVGSENSNFYALTSSGDFIWSYDTGGAIYSSPAIDSSGNIYFGSADHYLYSLSPQGNLNWRYSTGGDIYSSPTIASNGSIYFGSRDNKLYALRSAASGLQADSPWPKFRYNALNQGSSHNEQPVANAGANQEVQEGSPVDLIGTATDSDGTIVAYSWSQLSGTSVSIASANSANASFIAPSVDADTNLLFQLQVTDSSGGTDIDTVTITVLDNPANQPPTAEAGDNQSQLEGTTVTLDGSESDDADGGSISAYSWSQFSGTEIVIIDSTSAHASFITPAVDTDTNLSFQLLVTDNDGAKAVDLVTITVTNDPDNQPPTVDAGEDQNQIEGIEVTLSGSATDADGGISTYSWSQLSGTEVVLVDSDGAQASFIAPAVDADTNLTFQLLVTDNDGASAIDTVTITVLNNTNNQLPVVDAGGDQNLSVGVLASLRGSASDSDGTIVSYLWSETSNSIASSGGVSINRADTATANFTVPTDLSAGSTLTFKLTATDNLGTSSSDSATVTITAAGHLKWRYPTGGRVSSPAIAVDGTVYVSSYDGYLYAIAPPNDSSQSGDLQWRYPIGGIVYSSPAIGADGTVYVGGTDGYLYAIAPPDDESQSGLLLWRYDTGINIDFSSPAIGADGTIYVGNYGGEIYAITPPSNGSQSGTLFWRYSTGDHVLSSPAIGPDGTIYIGSYDDYLYAIAPPNDDSQSGVLLWRYQTGGDVSSSPAIGADGSIYVGSNGYLYAIAAPEDDSQYGVLQWSYQTEGSVYDPTIGIDGSVYISSYDRLYAIAPPTDNNSQSGILLWHYQTQTIDHRFNSSPSIGADGTIYVGSNYAPLEDSHTIYAISPPDDDSQTGVFQWSYSTGGDGVSSAAISVDGTVYAGSEDGYLHAITSSSPGLADSAWPKFGYDNQNTGRANIAPTAVAGNDQSVAAGATVNLDGSSSSDSDGAIIDYYWQETSGFDISILNNNSAQASFIAPDDLSTDAILSIQLTVTDNSGATATDTLEVSVPANP